jgi:hypothetical protein
MQKYVYLHAKASGKESSLAQDKTLQDPWLDAGHSLQATDQHAPNATATDTHEWNAAAATVLARYRSVLPFIADHVRNMRQTGIVPDATAAVHTEYEGHAQIVTADGAKKNAVDVMVPAH